MPRFRLVQRDGVDTLHRFPAHEKCNLDDSERDKALAISDDEAMKLITGDGTVRACQHCFPLEGEE